MGPANSGDFLASPASVHGHNAARASTPCPGVLQRAGRRGSVLRAWPPVRHLRAAGATGTATSGFTGTCGSQHAQSGEASVILSPDASRARHIAVTLTVAAVLGCVESDSATSKTSRASRNSAALLAAVALVPPRGITLWMHPTAARIVVSVTPKATKLRACEVGTTFSHYWRGGCRRFVGGRVTLPTSGGAVHIGFRIVPDADHSVQVEQLRVQWHCVDHFFRLTPGSAKARLRVPVAFDC